MREVYTEIDVLFFFTAKDPLKEERPDCHYRMLTVGGGYVALYQNHK